MNIDALPFHIGARNNPNNSDGLPDMLPFNLYFDVHRAALVQEVNPELSQHLDAAYHHGALIGTPLDDDEFGRPYADDFLGFISRHAPARGRTLDVGAGIGYLTQRLCELGYQAVGIEPGRGYALHAIRFDVDIVRDFFPSPKVSGRFNLICSYAFLEHILDPIEFLHNVKKQLGPGGRAIFSVPDCSSEIVAGDPGMLLHEHISYFDTGSLSRLLESVGFNSYVTKSGYGRCLYAVAALDDLPAPSDDTHVPVEIVAAYPKACSAFIARSVASIEQLLAQGTVGVFCPGRGLAILNHRWPLRFFDDDPALHGKFLPPFRHRIESRDALIRNPVQVLVVLSRTFGEKIRSSLREDGYEGEIMTINELSVLAGQ